MRTQLSNILEILLAKNDIRIHPDEIKLQVSSHPSYPSLHALTGVLEHFGIPNLAIKLPASKEVLEELPTSFIAHVRKENKEQLVLIEKLKRQIKITADKNLSERISNETFLEMWDGIIVAIEKDNTVVEQPLSPFKNALKWFLISLGVLSFGYFMYKMDDPFAQSHFLLSAVGLIISIFIIREELGLQSTIINNFCNLSSNTSCEAALNSKGAKIFGEYKLSTICIVTFSTYLMYWLLFYDNGVFGYSALVATTLIAIPLTFFSLYYQYNVVRKWCPLCLGIVAVLWMQVATIALTDALLSLTSNSWYSYFFLLASVVASFGVWSFVKPFLERIIRLDEIEVDHLKFKRNFTVFEALQNEEKSLNTAVVPIPGEIILGNQKAPLNLVLVTNPLCHYCKQAHSDLMKVLQNARDKVKITVRFNVNINDKESQSYQVASQLLRISDTQNAETSLQALHEVFEENIDHDQWLANNQKEINLNYNSTLQKQYDWCKDNGINFTHALIVKGKQFPKAYDRTDLIYFIDDLIEQLETNNSMNGALVVAG